MTEFIYNGNKYSTWNLKKELKKMGIKKEDISILEEVKKEEIKDIDNTYQPVVYWNPVNNHTYYGFRSTNKNVRPLEGEAYYNAIKDKPYALWDEETKTGPGREWTKEFVINLKLLNGKPKYPIEIGKDGMPILETVYTEWLKEI